MIGARKYQRPTIGIVGRYGEGLSDPRFPRGQAREGLCHPPVSQ